jgi:hypothetical protein
MSFRYTTQSAWYITRVHYLHSVIKFEEAKEKRTFNIWLVNRFIIKAGYIAIKN